MVKIRLSAASIHAAKSGALPSASSYDDEGGAPPPPILAPRPRLGNPPEQLAAGQSGGEEIDLTHETQSEHDQSDRDGQQQPAADRETGDLSPAFFFHEGAEFPGELPAWIRKTSSTTDASSTGPAGWKVGEGPAVGADLKDLEERLDDPETFVAAEVTDELIQPVYKSFAIVDAPEQTTSSAEPTTAVPPDRASRRFAEVPDLSLDASGDIPVTVSAEDIETCNSFFADIPVDINVRLSSKYLLGIPRMNVLFAAAPLDFEKGAAFNLGTRYARAFTVLSSVVAETIKNYSRACIQYLDWCEENKIPAPERFPINPVFAIMWASTFVGKVQPCTIRSKLDALAFWSAAHIVPFELNSVCRRQLLRAAKNAAPQRKAPRPGVKVSDLIALYEQCGVAVQGEPAANNFYVALFACVTVGFFTMARLGELVPPTTGKKLKKNQSISDIFDPETDLHGQSVTFFDENNERDEFAYIKLNWDKSQQREADGLFVTHQLAMDSRIDPLLALMRHLVQNKPTKSDPLFSYIDRDNRRQWLATGTVMREVNKLLEKVGRGPYSGHNLRIGGTNFYVLAGVSPDYIRLTGRWRSKEFETYVREKSFIARTELANLVVNEDPELKKVDFLDLLAHVEAKRDLVQLAKKKEVPINDEDKDDNDDIEFERLETDEDE